MGKDDKVYSEVEIKEKMAKPRLLVSAVGMPRDQMAKVQSEMANADSDQYIWLFDKPIDSTARTAHKNSPIRYIFSSSFLPVALQLFPVVLMVYFPSLPFFPPLVLLVDEQSIPVV